MECSISYFISTQHYLLQSIRDGAVSCQELWLRQSWPTFFLLYPLIEKETQRVIRNSTFVMLNPKRRGIFPVNENPLFHLENEI